MSHNGANKAPGRLMTPAEVQAQVMRTAKNKARRIAKRKRRREYWSNNKEYQAKQAIRRERLCQV